MRYNRNSTRNFLLFREISLASWHQTYNTSLRLGAYLNRSAEVQDIILWGESVERKKVAL